MEEEEEGGLRCRSEQGGAGSGGKAGGGLTEGIGEWGLVFVGRLAALHSGRERGLRSRHGLEGETEGGHSGREDAPGLAGGLRHALRVPERLWKGRWKTPSRGGRR